MVTTRRGLDTESQDGSLGGRRSTQKRERKDAVENTRSKRLRSSQEEGDEPEVSSSQLWLGASLDGTTDNPTAVGTDAASDSYITTPESDERARKEQVEPDIAISEKLFEPNDEHSVNALENVANPHTELANDNITEEFDGDIINVAASSDGSRDPSDGESEEPEDGTIFATPVTHKAESVYATPATHPQTPGYSSREGQSALVLTSSRAPTITAIPKIIPIRSASAAGDFEDMGNSDIVKDSHVQRSQVQPSARSINTSVQIQEIKAKHIRFGSEEPGPQLAESLTSQDHPVEQEEENDSESDDDAPETLTRDAALEQIAKEEQDVAERTARDEAAALEKRRRKEKRLSEQAQQHRLKIGKQQRTPSKADLDLNNLPNLLPAELLSAAPAQRPLTPPPVVKALALHKSQKKQPLKFADTTMRDPKDRVVDGNKVRVLQNHSKLLAPKANGSTKSIRERWLQGWSDNHLRKGYRAGKMERKEIYRGFLRR